MTRAGVLTDELWAVIEPVLPSDVGRRGQRWSDHRMILEGVAWRYRVGAPWRDLPAEFGPWQTVWKRHHRWSLDGTYAKLFVAVQESFGPLPEEAELADALMSVDSTSIRAHLHAAGGRGDNRRYHPAGLAAVVRRRAASFRSPNPSGPSSTEPAGLQYAQSRTACRASSPSLADEVV